MLITIQNLFRSSVSLGGKVGTIPGSRVATFDLTVAEMEAIRPNLMHLASAGVITFSSAANDEPSDDAIEMATIDYVNTHGGGGDDGGGDDGGGGVVEPSSLQDAYDTGRTIALVEPIELTGISSNPSVILRQVGDLALTLSDVGLERESTTEAVPAPIRVVAGNTSYVISEDEPNAELFGGAVEIMGGDVSGNGPTSITHGGGILIQGGLATDTDLNEGGLYQSFASGGTVVIRGGAANSHGSIALGGEVRIEGGPTISGELSTAIGSVTIHGSSIFIGREAGSTHIASGRITNGYTGLPWAHVGTLTRRISVRRVTAGGTVTDISWTANDQIVALDSSTAPILYTVPPDGLQYEPILIKKISTDTNPISLQTIIPATARIEGVLANIGSFPPYPLPGSTATTRPCWTVFTDGINHYVIVH